MNECPDAEDLKRFEKVMAFANENLAVLIGEASWDHVVARCGQQTALYCSHQLLGPEHKRTLKLEKETNHG